MVLCTDGVNLCSNLNNYKPAKVAIYRKMVDFKCGTPFGIFDLSDDEIFK